MMLSLKIIIGLSIENLKMLYLPFFIKEKAKDWYNKQGSTFYSWDEVEEKFLLKFYPLSKNKALIKDIQTFSQFDGETFNESWERFKDLIQKHPYHDIEYSDLAQDFYDSLNDSHKKKVDNMSGGYFYHAFKDEVFDILERFAEIDLQQMNASKNGHFLKRGGLHQVSFNESTLEKEEILKALGKLSEKVNRLTTNAPLIKAKICSLCCSKDHEDGACQGMTREEEEVHVVNYTTSWNEQRGKGSNFNWQTKLAPQPCPHYQGASSQPYQTYHMRQ